MGAPPGAPLDAPLPERSPNFAAISTLAAN
jgi:hypothetical protein